MMVNVNSKRSEIVNECIELIDPIKFAKRKDEFVTKFYWRLELTKSQNKKMMKLFLKNQQKSYNDKRKKKTYVRFLWFKSK